MRASMHRIAVHSLLFNGSVHADSLAIVFFALLLLPFSKALGGGKGAGLFFSFFFEQGSMGFFTSQARDEGLVGREAGWLGGKEQGGWAFQVFIRLIQKKYR